MRVPQIESADVNQPIRPSRLLATIQFDWSQTQEPRTQRTDTV